MYKFEIKSLKYSIIVVLVCIIFCAIVNNAYRYLPEAQNNKKQAETIDNIYEENNNTSEEAIEEPSQEEYNDRNDEYETDQSTKEVDEPPVKQKEKLTPLEPLDDSEIINSNNKQETIDDVLAKAQNYEVSKNFENAIIEYKKAVEMTDLAVTKASCLEKIAICYGKARRYGSAISFAQKAYNVMPTPERELLIARLYYKTGDTEKAMNKVTNILKRDLNSD